MDEGRDALEFTVWVNTDLQPKHHVHVHVVCVPVGKLQRPF
jgi:hypothetical protein